MFFFRYFILKYNYLDILLLMVVNFNYFKMKLLFINLEFVLYVFIVSRWDNMIKNLLYIVGFIF